MQSPFKFLDSYSKADKDIFFGRDREIEELYQKVYESKVLLIYGVSGTGKSSLIDCGLGNKIDDSDWLPVNVRRGSGMVESLVKQLISHEGGSGGYDDKGTRGLGDWGSPKQVVKLIKSVYLDHFKPIYLIFDQFEELFIFGSLQERKQFIEIIKSIVEADVQCKMLFSIREEYLANITEFERMVPEIMQNRMRVEKMSRANALEVISGPCGVNGIELENGFEEALMRKLVPEGNEVELTYLQVYLDKVFRVADAESQGDSARFTLDQLDELGNVGDLLGSFLEDQITELENPESGLAVLKSFVSVKGTKRQITHEEVLESCKSLGQEVGDEALKELINKFVDLRLLRDKDENGRYELRHDSLAAKIFEKITLVEKEVMEVRLFIENAHNSFLARKTLLSDDDLAYIAPYEDRLFLVKELQAFVDKSKDDIEIKKRSFRRITAISMIGFLIILLSVGYYSLQKSKSREIRNIVMISSLSNEFSPVFSLKTALEAYQKDSLNSPAIKSVLDAFYLLQQANIDALPDVFNADPTDSPIERFHFSLDGLLIYGWTEAGCIKLWNMTGEEIYSRQLTGETISVLKLSSDNEFLGALLNDSIVRVFSIKDSSSFSFKTTPNHLNNKYLFDFSGGKESLMALVNGSNIDIIDRDGLVMQSLEGHKDKINCIDISPDREFIVSGSDDTNIIIWYYNSVQEKYKVYSYVDSHSRAIRSCVFNSHGNYFIAAGEDSITAIYSLTGEPANAVGHSLPGLMHFTDTHRDSLLGFEVDVYFSSNDKIVQFNVFEESGEMKHGVLQGKKFLYHSSISASYRTTPSRYNYHALEKRMTFPVWKYLDIATSPNTRLIATVMEGSEFINLNAWDHLQLKKFKGSQPLFSSDGNYLYYIHGKHIAKSLVDPQEINKLVFEDEVFGAIKDDFPAWYTY